MRLNNVDKGEGGSKGGGFRVGVGERVNCN